MKKMNLYEVDVMIGWGLASLFSTNTAISETKVGVIYNTYNSTLNPAA